MGFFSFLSKNKNNLSSQSLEALYCMINGAIDCKKDNVIPDITDEQAMKVAAEIKRKINLIDFNK